MTFDIADPEINSILQAYRLESIFASDETIYVLRPDLTLVFVNQGWSRFAAQNGGEPTISKRWPIGSSIQDVIPEILLPFFATRFAQCLETRSPWQHRYECSSQDDYREFMMTTYPLSHRKGFLVINSQCRSFPHSRVAQPPLEEQYRDSNGMIMQCVHCRRVKQAAFESTWDWVPDWLESIPKNISHGLCEPCFGYFYPGGFPLKGGYPKFVRTSQ